MQTLDFSDDFRIKNQALISLIISKPEDLQAQFNKIFKDTSLLVALFQTQDKKEMQQAMITLKDEKTYLLTFSNTQSLQSWNKDARPLPLKALDIVKSIKLLEIDGFIIDINEDHRFKVESSLFDDIDNDVNKTYLNENFRDEIQKMIENYPEIDSIDIQHSNVCSARIVFYSKQDIADLVIEISKKLQENEQIQSLAPRGLDLLVGKK